MIRSGTPNWGTGIAGSAHTREVLAHGEKYRLRQNGIVQRLRVNLQDPTGLTGFYFRIWRKIGSTYDMVGSSENLAPEMMAGPNTLDLKRPIAVLEGDYYGYRTESTTGANFFARTNQPQASSYSVTDLNAARPDCRWEGTPQAARTGL